MRKKILVKGPAMSRSGYGEQCRFALRCLRSKEHIFDIYLENISWGNTGWINDDTEEREWLDKFINNGFVDTFRYFNSSPHKYSWWSYRANSRANNKGWRIDYLLATVDLQSNLKESFILPDVYHSDHCPIGLKIKI